MIQAHDGDHSINIEDKDHIYKQCQSREEREPSPEILRIPLGLGLENNDVAANPSNATPNNLITQKALEACNLISNFSSLRPGGSKKESFSPRGRRQSNLIFTTLVESGSSRESLKKLVKFVVMKIMTPLFTFAIICVCLILVHIKIGDYCFYPSLCSCQNLLIYIYTIVKEIINTQAGMIIVLYYGTGFITHDFYQNKILKVLYAFFILVVFGANFSGFYSKRNEDIYNELITVSGYCLIGANYIFLLIMGLASRKINSEFMKRTFMVSILQLYLFFHRFYIKNFVFFDVLESMERYFGKDLGMNVFKMFLMGYYMFYDFASTKFLFYFFKKILAEPGISYNMAIFSLKFVSVDVLSIKAFNALTISLSQIYSWISFFLYLYAIFSCYTRTNILVTFPLNVFRRIFKKKKTDEKEMNLDEKLFNDLRSGCIFETNLIIFLRIISFKLFNYFVFFTPEQYLYLNCSLQEKHSDFALYDINVIILMVTHTVLLVGLGLAVYGLKKEQYLFDYQVEEINIVGRFFLFMTCFAYADYTLQIYKAFEDIYFSK